MSHSSIITGRIRSVGLNQRCGEEIKKFNFNSIDAFNDQCELYPPLHSDIFSLSNERLSNFDFSILTFGACYKNLHEHWSVWEAKFTDLLQKLFWFDVVIYYEGIPDDFKLIFEAIGPEVENFHKGEWAPIKNWNLSGSVTC